MRTITLNIQVNNPRTDDNELNSMMFCDDEQHVARRVEEAIEWYGKRQGYRLRWNAAECLETIERGEWGYEGDDYAEPPTVGNEVI